MQLSHDQQVGREKVLSWFERVRRSPAEFRNRPIFKFRGFAGTGKTYMAISIIEDVDGDVLCAAPTAKAAIVMRDKGCPRPRTIHKLIYQPMGRSSRHAEQIKETSQELELLLLELQGHPDVDEHKRVRLLRRALKQMSDKDNAPIWKINPESELKDASLLVIDESSMVDDQMYLDLLSFEVPILAIGDPGQLPPVRGGTSPFMRGVADHQLTEIHRQAKESPVLRLATAVRNGESLQLGAHGDSLVIDRNITAEEASAADMVIVGKNHTRHVYNQRIRELRGFGGDYPQTNERVICLRNNGNHAMVNGELWNVIDSCRSPGGTRISLDLESDDDHKRTTFVEAHAELFLGNKQKPLTPAQAHDLDTQHFDYAYAVTCHKAQGSQWDTIVVKDQAREANQDPKLWLYTAITRAKKRVIVRLPE